MYSRSSQSLVFETFWRSLRGERLVPDRGDFAPGRAARFLPNIVLLEAPGDERHSLRIRVAGQVFQQAIPYNLAGTDLLELLPARYRAGAVASGCLMVSKPCGLWQITPVHLRGYAKPVEVTAFPLGAVSVPLIIAYVLSLKELLPTSGTPSLAMEADTAMEFRFLDVGAGEPEWPGRAA
jgi:hypothetical protein